MRLQISRSTYERRIERIKGELQKRGLDALMVLDATNAFYVSGVPFLSTERPIGVVVPLEGELTVVIPKLEEDHIRDVMPWIKDMSVYFEYPSTKMFEKGPHPMEHIAEVLKGKGLAEKKIGYDRIAQRSGYKGPTWDKVLPKAEMVGAGDIISEMRQVKDTEEIALMKESARWGNLALTYLQEYVKPGLSEAEVSMRASYEATMAMTRALGPGYIPYRGRIGAGAGFRSQIGKDSAYPHAFMMNLTFKCGDVLGTGAGANVGGYQSELERTMIIGKPTEKQEKYFNLMIKAQDAALEMYKPGVRCCDVNMAALEVCRDAGCTDAIKHHTGHGIGLQGHEPPFLDAGVETVLKPGMAFSCEPGIYFPGFAGFRHSDTVVITEDGCDIITYYPRDIDSLTIPC